MNALFKVLGKCKTRLIPIRTIVGAGEDGHGPDEDFYIKFITFSFMYHLVQTSHFS